MSSFQNDMFTTEAQRAQRGAICFTEQRGWGQTLNYELRRIGKAQP